YFTKLSDTLEEVGGAFDIYRGALAGLDVPLLEVIGNHDCASALPQELPEYYKGEYQKLYGPLWYSFDYGEWHFIVLDGNAPQPPPNNWLNEEELEWLGRDLAFQPQARPIILLSHQPLFFCRNYEKLLQIVEGYNIAVALSGHEHATYTRVAGLTNTVTGALSGRWWGDDGIHWNGHNTDGSPQGFRVCRIDGKRFSSEYVEM
ncbi:MAG: metallophosphoesterase family protein, partial [Candidatus Bipolaricaulia bacterium]